MRKVILLLVHFFVIPSFLFSQQAFEYQKHDFIWLTGYDWTPPFGGTIIDFNNDTLTLSYEYREMDFNVTDASICDKEGNLLFYTNGAYIADKHGESMENGEGLNGTSDNDGYRLTQGALILPVPSYDSLFYILHENKTWLTLAEEAHLVSTQLFYSTIDINKNDELGIICNKNIPIIQDTLDTGSLISSRHANGRDWWIVVPRYANNGYYKMLFSPNGVENLSLQEIEDDDYVPYGLGQSVFSPNGKKYVHFSTVSVSEGQFIKIMDFDPCLGEFYNPLQIMYNDTAYAGGVAISPNNRFLYVPSFKYVYQYDLEADDIEASKETVATYDWFLSESFGLPTTFFLAQLAPDNKIYINASNGVEYMHIIHNPNAKGAACQMEQHGLKLPTLNAFSMPNNPYFRLGPLDGSPCDTLGWDNHPRSDFYTTTEEATASFWDYSLFSPTEWTWDFGDGSLPTFEQNAQHSYTESGVYEVCLTVSNENATDTHCEWVEIIITGTYEPISPLKQVKLFPNPTSDYFYFSYFAEQEGVVRLYDAYGRQVRQRKLLSGNVTQAWDVQNLVSGVYFLEVSVDNQVVYSEKMLKM